MQTTLQSVENRVVFLEKLNNDWNKLHADLNDLRQWTIYSAPILVEALQTEETEPRERLNSAKVLQRNLVGKIELTKQLEEKCKELTGGKFFN